MTPSGYMAIAVPLWRAIMSSPYMPGSTQPLEIICPHCGRPNPPGMSFCSSCGQSLVGVAARVPGYPEGVMRAAPQYAAWQPQQVQPYYPPPPPAASYYPPPMQQMPQQVNIT